MSKLSECLRKKNLKCCIERRLHSSSGDKPIILRTSRPAFCLGREKIRSKLSFLFSYERVKNLLLGLVKDIMLGCWWLKYGIRHTRKTLIAMNSFIGSKDCKHKDLKVLLWQNENSDEKDSYNGSLKWLKSLSCLSFWRALKWTNKATWRNEALHCWILMHSVALHYVQFTHFRSGSSNNTVQCRHICKITLSNLMTDIFCYL